MTDEIKSSEPVDTMDLEERARKYKSLIHYVASSFFGKQANVFQMAGWDVDDLVQLGFEVLIAAHQCYRTDGAKFKTYLTSSLHKNFVGLLTSLYTQKRAPVEKTYKQQKWENYEKANPLDVIGKDNGWLLEELPILEVWLKAKAAGISIEELQYLANDSRNPVIQLPISLSESIDHEGESTNFSEIIAGSKTGFEDIELEEELVYLEQYLSPIAQKVLRIMVESDVPDTLRDIAVMRWNRRQKVLQQGHVKNTKNLAITNQDIAKYLGLKTDEVTGAIGEIRSTAKKLYHISDGDYSER